LTENTRLVMYPRCFAMANPLRKTVVMLGAGDCAVFSGDGVHSVDIEDSLGGELPTLYACKTS
jgi:hypothetical protein